MNFHHPNVLYIGIPIFLGLYLLFRLIRRNHAFKKGVRVANTALIKENKIFKKQMRIHKVTGIFMELILVVLILSVFFLMARPYEKETINQGVRKRDIFLCMDNGIYLDDLNEQLLDEMISLVESLDGDRFGISVFCSTSLLYVPITDDYDYIISKLNDLKDYFRLIVKLDQVYGAYGYNLPGDLPPELAATFQDDYDRYEELSDELTTPTYQNSWEKGHFLVGDGLASCMYSFPKFGAEDRSRIILLSTENTIEVGSKPVVLLDEACDLCAKNDVTVFGLFRGEQAFDQQLEPNDIFVTSTNIETDYETAKADLIANVAKTGGEVYEYGVMSVADIVKDIKKQPAMLVDEVVINKEIDQPHRAEAVLIMCAAALLVCAIIRGH